jgi:hypothetical protein
MKKYIVLSVNDNVDYLYFTPLICWAWRKFGWEPVVMYHGKETEPYKLALANEIECTIDQIEGYRSDTITQISRLYSGCFTAEGYYMTGDIDMLPLSNYWKPDTSKVTVYGHDLTGFGHFPICYIGATLNQWQQVMNVENLNHANIYIKRDLDTLPQAKDPDFYKYWFSDQDLITARLKEYGTGKIDFINRGQGSHGYARGRVDRGSNGWVLDQPELIDAHLMQQTHHSEEKIRKLMDLLHHVWPKEDWKWFLEYTKEFKKLAV